MSAYGPKQTSLTLPHMSAFGGKADITVCGNPLSRSLLGVKRTCLFALHMSAFDPKRTWVLQRSTTSRALTQIATITCLSLGGDYEATQQSGPQSNKNAADSDAPQYVKDRAPSQFLRWPESRGRATHPRIRRGARAADRNLGGVAGHLKLARRTRAGFQRNVGERDAHL
jgi:hypothetical protein